MIREEDVLTLMELGLTRLEAKTYLALSKVENAAIKTISKTANIAKQDVYRIIPRLQALGLVEKVVAPQATYQAVPLQSGILALLQTKAREYDNLQKRTTALVRNFRKSKFDQEVRVENPQFRIISEKFLLLRTLDDLTDNTRETIDVAHFWEFTRGMLFKHEPGILKRAMSRGVRIKWITETHKEDKEAKKILATLTEYPLFEIRYVPPPISVRLAIYDRKDAIIGLNHLTEDWVTSMVSNNKFFAEVMTNYHEHMWNNSSSCPDLK